MARQNFTTCEGSKAFRTNNGLELHRVYKMLRLMDLENGRDLDFAAARCRAKRGQLRCFEGFCLKAKAKTWP